MPFYSQHRRPDMDVVQSLEFSYVACEATLLIAANFGSSCEMVGLFTSEQGFVATLGR